MQLLFPKEEEIMYAIWEIGHPCGLSEILHTHPNLKRNTVAKVLGILQEKGYLQADSIVKTKTRTGRGYSPMIAQKDYDDQKRMMENLVESPNVKKGMLSYLSALAETKGGDSETAEMLSEMEEMIRQYRNDIENR